MDISELEGWRMSQQVTLEEYKKAYREMILGESRMGFYIHLTVYVIVNALLVSINYFYTPTVLWFIFPLAGWGIGIVAHYFGAIRLAPRDLTRKEAEAEYRARSHEALTR
jgi:hypothetical protein